MEDCGDPSPILSLSSIFGDQDSLDEHISQTKLPLVKFGVVRSNGDCYYDSLFNLMELHNHHLIEEVSNSLELRVLLATSIGKTIDSIAKPSSDENVRRLSENPMYLHWFSTIFHGKRAEVKSFVNKHSRPCEYTDNNGLIPLHTAHFLGVNLHIVGTSNNMQDPFTEVRGSSEIGTPIFWIGFYQVKKKICWLKYDWHIFFFALFFYISSVFYNHHHLCSKIHAGV